VVNTPSTSTRVDSARHQEASTETPCRFFAVKFLARTAGQQGRQFLGHKGFPGVGYRQLVIAKDEIYLYPLVALTRPGVVSILHKLKGPSDAGTRWALLSCFDSLADASGVVLCCLLNTSIVEFCTG